MNSLRSIWNQMPAVRLLAPYIAGILCCIEIRNDGHCGLWIASGLLLFSMAVLVYVNGINSAVKIYRWRYVSGGALILGMMCLGYEVAFFRTDTSDPNHIAHVALSKDASYIGVIADPIVLRDKTVSALIELQSIVAGDMTKATAGKVLASIVKDDKSAKLQYGDKLIFKGDVMVYEAPKNPDQFDYKSYQAFHHIYHRVYLNGSTWKVMAKDQGNTVLSEIYDVRTYFLSLIKETVPGTNELAVATAIMLGYRDYVTDEVMQAYAGSGVLHVLSVSGLHVAVLYYVLNLLLGWMDRRSKLKIAKGILVIIIMLFYAGLTGLSPPVLRSVWMFTLITVARLLDREVSMYNVLGVSCLALLIWDPYYIADVGFELSYIAVIVYLYPFLHALIAYSSFDFKKPFGFVGSMLTYGFDFVWGLICVSIAAQIATFPISMYYFHTFPNFFLLSNLLVIPLSNFVLISGMGLFAAGWSHQLVIYVGWIFDHLLIMLNSVVFWVDSLPFSLSRGTVISLFEMVLLYIAIVMICWFMADRRAKVLLTTLTCVLVLCSTFSMSGITKDKIQKLIVYHVQGRKAIAFIVDRNVYYDFDSALIHNESLMRYNVRDHWWQCGIKKEVPIDSLAPGYKVPYGRIYTIKGKRILIIDKDIPRIFLPRLSADVVILSGNSRNSLEEVRQIADFREVVFDTSCKSYQVKKWIEDCEKAQVHFHDCRDRAFEMQL